MRSSYCITNADPEYTEFASVEVFERSVLGGKGTNSRNFTRSYCFAVEREQSHFAMKYGQIGGFTTDPLVVLNV